MRAAVAIVSALLIGGTAILFGGIPWAAQSSTSQGRGFRVAFVVISTLVFFVGGCTIMYLDGVDERRACKDRGGVVTRAGECVKKI